MTAKQLISVAISRTFRMVCKLWKLNLSLMSHSQEWELPFTSLPSKTFPLL